METSTHFQNSATFAAILFAYTAIEFSFISVYVNSIQQCRRRLEKALSAYTVPGEVSRDIVKQLGSMPHVRTFYRDLFDCSSLHDIKHDNMVRLFNHTMGVAQPYVSFLIQQVEKQLDFRFAPGFNAELQHAYCREDRVIRSVYLPSLLKGPLVLLKFSLDLLLRLEYEKVDTPHLIYWVRRRRRSRSRAGSTQPLRVLVFMCGIGIGVGIYCSLLRLLHEAYDVVVICEIKWISFHLTAWPVEDRELIADIAEFLPAYLSGIASEEAASGGYEMDIMAHSGGALYFRRLLALLEFRHKVLIEPACFLGGCSSATRQIYTYNTFVPLFFDPLIKNLPKLLDITETVLLSDTVLDGVTLVLSENDTLFNPLRILPFMRQYHPHVPVIVIPNSAHGDAVSKHAALTCRLITKNLGLNST